MDSEKEEHMDMEILSKIIESSETLAGKGIDKISNALGILFPFAGIRKRAVEAYIKDIEKGNYTSEEKAFFMLNTKNRFKELKNQVKIGEIAKQNAKEGTDFSMNSLVDDEWLSRFMDAAKFVSDEETQLMWGKILAGEFEVPGSTPPTVIRILSEITKEYATIFSNLSALRVNFLQVRTNKVQDEGASPMIMFIEDIDGYLEQLGIDFDSLHELDQLGLINFDDSLTGFAYQFSPAQTPYIHIVSQSHVLTVIDPPNNTLACGPVLFTNAGLCIARFIPQQYNPEHMKHIKSYLENLNFTISPEPKIKIIEGQEEGEKHKGNNYETQWIILP